MLQTIIGALTACLDGMSGIIIAGMYGFAATPTAILFAASALGMLAFGQVTPLAVLSELVTCIGGLTKKQEERQSISVYAGLILLLLGITGALGMIVDFVGGTILSGVMAGVGLILARVSLQIAHDAPATGYTAMGFAIVVYLLTGNIIYTMVAGMGAAAILWNILKVKKPGSVKAASINMENEKFRFRKPVFNMKVLRGSLAAATLMLGSVISEGTVTNQLAGTEGNLDLSAIYLGVGSAVSALFGGAPGGTIVSATGTAPHPLLCGVLFGGIMAVILALKLGPKIMRFVPADGLAGTLFVLGLFVVLPDNALAAFSGQPLLAGVTMAVTVFADPFIGLAAGVAMRFILIMIGAL